MNPVVEAAEVVEQVKQYQVSNAYTDQQMAEKIGYCRETYNQMKNGKTRASRTFIMGAKQLLSLVTSEGRVSIIERETRETSIRVELSLDGSGKYEINTGITMFDHLLSQLAWHGVFDVKIAATGDDPHHLIEDVAICLGQAFSKALGEKRGIVRMADVAVPMDEALAMVAVDISGRGYTVLELSFAKNDMAGFPTDLIRHFLESFALEARANLHARVSYGTNDHHKAEALFKALGRVLDMATRIDERRGGELPSTKDLLEG